MSLVSKLVCAGMFLDVAMGMYLVGTGKALNDNYVSYSGYALITAYTLPLMYAVSRKRKKNKESPKIKVKDLENRADTNSPRNP